MRKIKVIASITALAALATFTLSGCGSSKAGALLAKGI